MRWIPLAVALAALSCEGGTTETADFRRRLLESWGEAMVVPTLQTLEAQAAALTTASEALCARPSTETLAAARAAWSDARAPWKQTEVFAFGPSRDEPLRLGPKLDSWPMRPESVERVLAGDQAVDATGVARLGSFERGFPAVEYLLWGVDDPVAFADRRCAYLIGASSDLAANATAMRAAWDPAEGDFAGRLARSGSGEGAFDTLQMAFAEVVNRMGHTIDTIRFEKLGKPVGLDGASGDPTKAESPLSGRSVADIHDALTGIAALYHGANGGIGLTDYLAFRGHAFDARFDAHLKAGRAALDAIEGPLTLAAVERPEQVRAAIEALSAIQVFIQVDIANALSVALSFNDSDGD